MLEKKMVNGWLEVRYYTDLDKMCDIFSGMIIDCEDISELNKFGFDFNTDFKKGNYIHFHKDNLLIISDTKGYVNCENVIAISK